MSNYEELIYLNKRKIKFYDQLFPLNNEKPKRIKVIYVAREWGADKNLIGYFKSIDSNQIFKLNIFRDLTTDMYGIGEDLKKISFGTLLLIEIQKDIGKDNFLYTRVLFLLSLNQSFEKTKYILE